MNCIKLVLDDYENASDSVNIIKIKRLLDPNSKTIKISTMTDNIGNNERRFVMRFQAHNTKQILAAIKILIWSFVNDKILNKELWDISFTSRFQMGKPVIHTIEVMDLERCIFGTLQQDLFELNVKINKDENLILQNLQNERNVIITKINRLIPEYCDFITRETIKICKDILVLLSDSYEFELVAPKVNI